MEGPSQYVEAKAIQLFFTEELPSRSPRAWHVGTVNVGTWENLRGKRKMCDDKIKKDHFKTSQANSKVVRLARSSEEVE